MKLESIQIIRLREIKACLGCQEGAKAEDDFVRRGILPDDHVGTFIKAIGNALVCDICASLVVEHFRERAQKGMLMY